MYQSLFIRLLAMLMLSTQISIQAQEISQTVRGSVVDLETNTPLLAATIAIYKDSILVVASTSDSNGDFRIENIPVGRYSVVSSFIGYREVVIPDVIVNSMKEVILSVQMEESPLEIAEIQVSATGQKGTALNKLAYVSARTFSVEESQRYAGSRGDPARMAANFAGVQGNDDSNNDLVIRGNSPLGVLWRLEGVNIPNPNHFGVSGTTGGPVTILNNKVLSLSDFMTGAFPAEYGNSIAGVFDLRMRNGNNEKHEFSGQLGFLGTELMAEGPICKESRSSYLAAYRYSTMDIFHALGIEIGTDAVPKYQDLSFKLNFPTKEQGNISLFGMGGKSAVDILASEQLDPDKGGIYGDEAMDEHFRTGMGVLGANYSRPTGTNSFLKLTISASREHQSNHLDKVYRHIDNGWYEIDSMWFSFIRYHSDQNRYSASCSWNKKLNKQHLLKTGFVYDLYRFDMDDSIYNETLLEYVTRLNHTGYAFLSQPFVQWKYKSSERMTITAGLHGQLLNLENTASWALEPRLGIRYQAGRRSTFGFGTGLHSQMLPTYIYFAGLTSSNGTFVQPNANLDFMNSYQNVLSWDYYLNSNMRVKLETYYQYLYNIPVEHHPSSYSVLDEGHNMSRFFPDSLVNKGTARNYGLELTMEKFFSKSYFLLFTASLYDARRTGSDGINYNTVFNGRYILNALGSKEFTWGINRRSTFTIGGKITLAGGKRYTPIDIAASDIAGEAVYIDALRNSMQFNPYLRADIKLNYRLNALKATHEFGLDIVNITDRDNVLKQTYISGNESPVQEVYQLGLLPIFYYKIDF
ncbi:MAG: carboxypeptidase regulatory-like domain-containing protein [Bacteroidota bacterium]